MNYKANPNPYHALDSIFNNPKSIAIIGAREKPNTAGSVVLKNLLDGGYKGKVYPINPKHVLIFDQKSYKTVEDVQETIDLAIIVTPAVVVSEVLTQCGKKGIKVAIIISSGFKEIGPEGKELEDKIKEVIKQYQIHVIGPNCLGVILPYNNMNATFGNSIASKGNVALISQSGALCAAILDWANQRNIGFSAVMSIGNAIDISFAELLSHLEWDPHTNCILLYIEGIKEPQLFLQNLKKCSLKKPVIIIKTGLSEQSSRALFSHTGALIGKDDVFDAAIKQNGAIRAHTMNDLFNATEMFSKNIKPKGNSLTIVSNGGGAGIIASDEASKLKINLLNLSEELSRKLNAILPKHWSHGNPIDIIGDAGPDRFESSLNLLLEDKECDAILVMLVPVAMSDPEQTATLIINLSKKSIKPILTCWMGAEHVKVARTLFHQHNIPTFDTPEEAIQAYSLLIRQQDRQNQLLENSISSNERHSVPLDALKATKANESKKIIYNAFLEDRKILNLIESKTILKNFNIPIAESYQAKSIEGCLKIAQLLGYPLVMKILSPNITHKQDVGGVQLNITTSDTLQHVFKKMINTTKEKVPNAIIEGVTLEKMYKDPNNRELMIGILKDPIFGPVISFGAGGSIVDLMQDRAIALPPFNMAIIENLISETRISKMLGVFRGMPSIRLDILKQILLNVSEITCELPQIIEMDINPLIANEDEVIAVDARIVIKDDNFRALNENRIQ